MTDENKVKFTTGLSLLRTRADNKRSYLQDLVYPKKDEAKYYKNRLYLGTVYGEDDYIFEKNDLKKFYISTNTSDISLFLGVRGAGKTFTMRGDLSRSFLTGYHCVYFDIKGEMRSNNKPISDKLLKKGRLAKNESPMVIPTKMVMPLFLEGTYKTPPDDIRFQFSLMDATEDDLLFILKPQNQNYENAIKIAHGLIKRRKIKSLDELKLYLLSKVHDNTKRTVNLSIDNMVQNRLFGEEYPLDIINILNNNVLALNLTNYETLDTRNGFTQLYAGILLRKIISLRKNKLLKRPVNVYLDEMHFFCPVGSDPPSKKPIIDMINVYRYLGFAGRFSTQYPEQLPEKDVINQIRHVFLPYNIKNDIMYFILKKLGIWEFGDTQRNKWVTIKKSMKQFTWMYFDANKVNAPTKLVKFYLPLCDHTTESRF